MSKKFKIFRNYGVLAAEKRNVYTYGGANPLSDYAEEITVKLPDNEFFELEEKLSRISEKQNETAREITQQAQDDKMAQKSGENPEKEAPEKLIDAVLTEVFS